MSLRVGLAFLVAALLVVVPGRADADTNGGTSYQPSSPSKTPKKHNGSPRGGTAAQAQAQGSPPSPVPTATVGDDGLAVAPAGAPPAVAALIAAGNVIASTPYRYGGGHGSFDDTAYDCSGSVSYALHGAGLLDATLDSTALAKWGVAGAGTWITIYANKTHTYLIVAGLRFDTSGARAAGTRWQAAPRSSKGFKVRHPDGL
jgi:cell wall-associated NlpC family hydrolase